MFAGVVGMCGVGVVVVGGDGGEWRSEMGPGRGVSSIEGTQGQQLGPEPAELGLRNTAAVDWRLCKGVVCVCNRVVVKSDWPYLAMSVVGGVCGVGRSRACSTTQTKQADAEMSRERWVSMTTVLILVLVHGE